MKAQTAKETETPSQNPSPTSSVDSTLSMSPSSGIDQPDTEQSKDKPSIIVVGENEVPTFPCRFPGCDGVFTTFANMKRHQQLHTGLKPYACTFDNQHSFTHKVHTRIHTKEKPYPCSFEGCHKRFSRISSCREHERNIHNAPKRKKKDLFPCLFPFCGSEFSSKKELEVHSKSHSLPPPESPLVPQTPPPTSSCCSQTRQISPPPPPITTSVCCGNSNCFCSEKGSSACCCVGEDLGCCGIPLESPPPIFSEASSHVHPTRESPPCLGHQHHPECGHLACVHDGHADFLMPDSNGIMELHHVHGGTVQKHHLRASASNPVGCNPIHQCGHDPGHVHGPGCGHIAIYHDDHVDYLVDNVLHHVHNGHCDYHGFLTLLPNYQESPWDELLKCSWDYCNGGCGPMQDCRCFQS